jgi:hypothetical protein
MTDEEMRSRIAQIKVALGNLEAAMFKLSEKIYGDIS